MCDHDWKEEKTLVNSESYLIEAHQSFNGKDIIVPASTKYRYDKTCINCGEKTRIYTTLNHE